MRLFLLILLAAFLGGCVHDNRTLAQRFPDHVL